MSRSSSKTSCLSICKPHSGYPLERKVIDASGRLGSLYDASTDRLIDHYSCTKFTTTVPPKRTQCVLIEGDRSFGASSVLKEIGFDPALRLSIGLQMVKTSGISRLIEYNQSIQENTRFLYYAYNARKEKLNLQARKADRIVGAPVSGTQSTHMITKILWGLEILFVIQISSSQPINEIDAILRRIGNELQHDRTLNALDNNSRRLIDQLTNVTVFGSDTCVYQQDSSILDIINTIQDCQKNANFHQPLIYTMQPLRWLYSGPPFSSMRFNSYPNNQYNTRIDIIINRINHDIKDLGEILQNLSTSFPSSKLNQLLKDARDQYRFLLDSHDDLTSRLRRNIGDVRREDTKSSVLDNIINDQRYECLHKTQIDVFRNSVTRLMKKFSLIEMLYQNGIEYILAFDFHANPATMNNIDDVLKRSYANQNVPINLWYSSDRLQSIKPDRWEQIYRQLQLERQKGASATIVYVDFSYFEQRLESFTIVRIPSSGPIMVTVDPLENNSPEAGRSTHRNISKQASKKVRSNSAPNTRKKSTNIESKNSEIISIPSPKQRPRKSSLSDSKTELLSASESSPPSSRSSVDINLLLLGETGVGKSTFINAFVNYLKFDSLQQAEQGEPVVLIPVSFLLTTGDNFDDFIVNFGSPNLNENYEHEGQSVTQQCKSYVFNLNNRLRLRLIDTPGLGDTRGINQDAKNIDHILNYVNCLPHINAICLLLKPNASRLSVFFRSCIKQILTYLTPNGYNNIIFCFTNARATFYAPGDTGPLLRKMLNDEHLNDIPFKKENTFCFDSESFRYLAARKCGVEFDEYQKQECISSWNTSVNESKRLLNFIQKCERYILEEWVSPRKAALDISMMARPLMETLRLIIFNMILAEAKLIANQIILHSRPVAIDLCTNCAQINIVEVGPLWCTQYQPSVLTNNGNQHLRCPPKGQHLLIESVIKYECMNTSTDLMSERWQSSFRNFLLKCDRLAHYLKQEVPSAQEDPFQPMIERFLQEEQLIAQRRDINSVMNRQVQEVLKSIKRIRQENSQQLFVEHENLSIFDLYNIIDELASMPTVKKQIDSIKTTRQLQMAENDQIVVTGNIVNKRLLP